MSSFIETYGGNLNTMAHSGLAAVRKAEAAGLSINQIRQMAREQGVSFGSGAQDYFRQKEISQLQDTFRQQMQAQATQFQAAQRAQQERLDQMQQQALQAQTRQAAPQKQAQVLGAGKSLTIRPGASTRFSRPELQIKSMNI